MAAVTLFHAEKCCHLAIKHETSAVSSYAAVPVTSWSIVHPYFLNTCVIRYGHCYRVFWVCRDRDSVKQRWRIGSRCIPTRTRPSLWAVVPNLSQRITVAHVCRSYYLLYQEYSSGSGMLCFINERLKVPTFIHHHLQEGWLGGVVVSGLVIERSRVRLPAGTPSGNSSGQVADTRVPRSSSSIISLIYLLLLCCEL